jgi:endonuclease/exonuclease/phosphatase family metal-dependent hydrolase
MKLLTAFCLLFSIAIHSNAQKNNSATLRIMTYNIRTSAAADSSNAWEFRKDNVAGQIRYHHPDLLGVQEAREEQLKDLQQRLPEYAWYGVGRDESSKSNEYSAIFYLKSRIKVLSSGTFWLSEDPAKPASKSWDSALPRICSWIKVTDLQTGKTFYHFNTHFDHKGPIARANGSSIILKKISEIAGNSQIVLTGDFNTTAQQDPYKIIVANGTLKDAQFISQTPHYGPTGTMSGFWVDKPLKNKIDFIFVSNGISVLQHAVLTDQQNNRYNSDHLAVLAEIKIN